MGSLSEVGKREGRKNTKNDVNNSGMGQVNGVKCRG